MNRPVRDVPGVLSWVLLAIALGGPAGRTAEGTELVLRDGRVLSGRMAMTTGMAENPVTNKPAGEGKAQMIVFVDDELRRTYVPKLQIREVRQEDARADVSEKFNIRQRTLRAGRAVKTVGPAVRIDPFDEYGRRIFTMNTFKGPVPVVQGITELTPQWTKIEGVDYIWDMRMATSAIPREVLGKILMKVIDPKNLEDRKKIARFYLQSERYEDSIKELEGIQADFPDPAVKQQIDSSLLALRQLAARRLLGELRLRREAGQHQLVLRNLETFPSEGVTGEVLQIVREMTAEYQALENRRKLVIQKIDELMAKVQDPYLLTQFKPIRDEMVAELSLNTIDRMAAFLQGLADADLAPGEKLALAVSGWMLGADAATSKLGAAISTHRVRQVVLDYMNEPVKINRARLYGSLVSEQSATPAFVASLLTQMHPPMPLPAANPDVPGMYELSVPGIGNEPPVRYVVQLPPEYDPRRRYPAIVTLQGASSTPEAQIDWWSGPVAKGGARVGQASRHGYIVIAPGWTVEHQKEYHYSAREHAAVLDSLRDACRRLAIDTDRVFLSGHSMGGDAAWDMALAHPDLWAGVIPIVAKADRYVAHYTANAKTMPLYFVCGELDGNRMQLNARDLDRYMTRGGYNVTVVEYLGRGHEDFSDEVQRIFDWMGRFHREFFPRKFTCSTMRRFDNFFWWVELSGMPAGTMVEPNEWPPRNPQPLQVEAAITDTNGLNVRAGASLCNVWLSPQMVDFGRRINLVVNGRRMDSRLAEPSLQVLLEDVRTRGDRQHPFWAKVEATTRRTAE